MTAATQQHISVLARFCFFSTSKSVLPRTSPLFFSREELLAVKGFEIPVTRKNATVTIGLRLT